jgi:hypothetical protein
MGLDFGERATPALIDYCFIRICQLADYDPNYFAANRY